MEDGRSHHDFDFYFVKSRVWGKNAASLESREQSPKRPTVSLGTQPELAQCCRVFFCKLKMDVFATGYFQKDFKW